MKTDFTIRQAQQSDAVELKELFQNTVIVINRRDYSQVEVEDWASCGDDLSNIEEMIKTVTFPFVMREIFSSNTVATGSRHLSHGISTVSLQVPSI